MEEEFALPCSQGPATLLRLSEFGPRFSAYFLKILFNLLALELFV